MAARVLLFMLGRYDIPPVASPADAALVLGAH